MAEQGVLWVKNFEETFINGRFKVQWDRMEERLTVLTKYKVQQTVTTTYSTFQAMKEALYTDNLFDNNVVDYPMVRAAFKQGFSTDNAVSRIIATNWFKELACNECIWRLKLLFFRDDYYGRNASLHLKRTIRMLIPDP